MEVSGQFHALAKEERIFLKESVIMRHDMSTHALAACNTNSTCM